MVLFFLLKFEANFISIYSFHRMGSMFEMLKKPSWYCLVMYSYTYAHALESDSRNVVEIGAKRVSVSILLGILCGFASGIFVAAIIRGFLLYMNTTPILKGPVVFSPKIDPNTLQLALDTEKHLLGSSPNGTYYRTALDDGLTVAIKTLEPFEIGSPETQNKAFKRILQQDIQLLGKLRHSHLMSLRAYVRHSDSFTLVYDYMSSGSLEDAINKVRQNQLQMGWDVRLRVALGIVKALKFLHFDCHPSVLHYNLKPSNVMLGDEFEPKLTDFGLANLMPKLYRSPNAYRAPDFYQNCRYTDKSDVYSFGVILGVLLTGRDPLDVLLGDAASGRSLGRWLQQMQQAGEARQALDKSMLGQDDEEEEMLMAVRIAVACMSELPEDRPSTDELVPMLSRLHSF